MLAVVLHWGDLALTQRCVDSLRVQAGAAVQVVVVDNGTGLVPDAPREGTPRSRWDVSPRTWGGVALVSLDDNFGFGGGMNRGVTKGLTLVPAASHVLLVNNDAILAEDCVATLLQAAGAFPIAVPTIVHGLPPAEGPLWYAGGAVSPWTGEPRHQMVSPGLAAGGESGGAQPVSFASGCVLLVEVAVWEGLGGFDEGYFLYHEDTDLCLRAAAAGWGPVWVPQARAWHIGGESQGQAGGKTPDQDYYDTRNGLRVVSRCFFGLRRVVAIAFWACVRVPRKVVRRLWRGPQRGAGLMAVAAGVRDGVLGRGGAAKATTRDYRV